MRLEEAEAWLRGERSWTNLFTTDPDNPERAMVAVSQVDAATTQQAYYIVLAHREGLV